MNIQLLLIINEIAHSDYDVDELCNTFSLEYDCQPAGMWCTSCPLYGGPTEHLNTCAIIFKQHNQEYSNESGTLINTPINK